MAGNRSLDEFNDGAASEDGAGDEEEPTATAPPGAGAGTDPEAAPDDEPVEPMAATYAWSGAGGHCEQCGATVEERWRDGDELVCEGCKAW